MTVDQKLHLVQTGGASLADYQPLFSHDGKFLLCPCGMEIKVYSTATAECVQRLISDNGVVTGITQHPVNKLQIISCTSRGMLTVWDYEDGIRLKSYDCATSVLGVFSEANIKTRIFIVITEEGKEVLARIALQVFLSANIYQGESIEKIDRNVCWKMPKAVGFLLCGKYIAFVKKKKICVVDSKLNGHSVDHPASSDGKVTCFACHPSEDCIATGHDSGKIKFWYNVCPQSGAKKELIVSSLHWHSTILKDLVFTPGGSSLLSVGAESVLVQWHYKEDTSRKSFLPRLGAPLCHISTCADGTLFASTHDDNSVSLITSYFTVKHVIRGLTSTGVGKTGSPSDRILQYDPKSKACVTTGKLGHLVFYDQVSDTELYSLDITHENYVAPDRSRELPRSVVTCVACPEVENSSTTYWIATTEVIHTTPTLQETKLKFWIFDETEQSWKLNTVVNDPHKQSVSQISFRPCCYEDDDGHCVISTGLDGMVKLWGLVKSSNSSFWSCEATACYREQPACFCDFSQDGSVVAVAFAHTVCLYDPETLENRSVLVSYERQEKIQGLLFGRRSCQHIIIVALKSRVQSYDLLHGSLKWVVDFSVSHLARDPLSEFMAALSESNDLFIFRPSCVTPIYIHKNITEQKVLCIRFFPHNDSQLDDCQTVPWMIHSRIYIINETKSLFALYSDAELKNRRDHTRLGTKSDASTLKTPMAYILDGTSKKEEPVKKVLATGATHRTQLSAVKSITDAPSHVLPSMATQCMEFIDSFMQSKTCKKGFYMGDSKEMSVHHETLQDHTKTVSDANLQIMMDFVKVEHNNSRSFEFLQGL